VQRSAPARASDDAEAPSKLDRILRSESCRRADEDVDFLNADETRGVRLQNDYLKPQLLLEQHGIQHTIVVFGGTRIVEPGAAAREVERLRQALRDRPRDPELPLRVPIMIPPVGVKPIVVSHGCPSLSATRLDPFPRWATITRPRASLPSACSTYS
jgi:hypothetical protein